MPNEMMLALVLVVVHFVGDFVCQSDWMAINKSKRWDALSLHVIVYGTVLAIGSVFFSASRDTFVTFVVANGALHFLTDAVTSRINARLWFIDLYKPDQQPTHHYDDWPFDIQEPPYDFVARMRSSRHWFFVAIGADQVLHYAALFITASWWLQ